MNKTRKKLMSDHVKERAIGFAEWLPENFWIRDPFPIHTGMYMWCKMVDDGKMVMRKTITQLYEEYLDIVFKQLST